MAEFRYARLLFLFGGRSQEPINRSQQLARHLARHVPLWYAPYGSLRHWIDREWRAPRWEPLAGHPNIEWIPTPPSVFLGRRSQLAGQLNGALVSRAIRHRLQRAGLTERQVLLLAYTPVAAEVVRRFPQTDVHYDCADDHEHWHGSTPGMSRLNRDNERYLVGRARTVTASALALQEKLRALHPNPVLVPNGVEYELFAHSNGHVPEELQRWPRPLIGFVGAAHGYVDVPLVRALAAARLGTLVFVGPLAPLARQLRAAENVAFLGPRAYRSLPDYLHGFDVAIIPANRAPASLTANPGKLYQYLAVGRPIVATDLPEFAPFRELVYLAQTPEQFIAQVGQALAEPPQRVEERRRAAADCAWERRADALFQVLCQS